MLSIGKLRPGSDDYYLREVAGPEEYYLGAGEAPGYWLDPALAERGLGLAPSGEVSGADLSAVLRAESLLTDRHLAAVGASSSTHLRMDGSASS